MADYVTLLGAEQVSSAACSMRSAAEQMSRAASNMDGSLERHQQFMGEWLHKLEQVLANNPTK